MAMPSATIVNFTSNDCVWRKPWASHKNIYKILANNIMIMPVTYNKNIVFAFKNWHMKYVALQFMFWDQP